MDLPGIHLTDFLIIVIPVGTGIKRLVAWLRDRRKGADAVQPSPRNTSKKPP